jgi:hypothetical protein
MWLLTRGGKVGRLGLIDNYFFQNKERNQMYLMKFYLATALASMCTIPLANAGEPLKVLSGDLIGAFHQRYDFPVPLNSPQPMPLILLTTTTPNVVVAYADTGESDIDLRENEKYGGWGDYSKVLASLKKGGWMTLQNCRYIGTNIPVEKSQLYPVYQQAISFLNGTSTNEPIVSGFGRANTEDSNSKTANTYYSAIKTFVEYGTSDKKTYFCAHVPTIDPVQQQEDIDKSNRGQQWIKEFQNAAKVGDHAAQGLILQIKGKLALIQTDSEGVKWFNRNELMPDLLNPIDNSSPPTNPLSYKGKRVRL